MVRDDVGLPEKGNWHSAQEVARASYVCGYCGDRVGSNVGYPFQDTRNKPDIKPVEAYIRICPSCSGPTYFNHQNQHWPRSVPGRPIKGIDDKKVERLYNEARSAAAAGAPTAAVMACRKILMNVANDQGAKEGLSRNPLPLRCLT